MTNPALLVIGESQGILSPHRAAFEPVFEVIHVEEPLVGLRKALERHFIAAVMALPLDKDGAAEMLGLLEVQRPSLKFIVLVSAADASPWRNLVNRYSNIAEIVSSHAPSSELLKILQKFHSV